MKLDNKNIIITGAASGIGKCMLDILIKYPCQILAVDLNNDKIMKHKSVTPFKADLASKEGTDSVFEKALSQWDSIDIFIANAGFAYYEELTSPDWERMEKIFRVNVFSPAYTAIKMKELFADRPYNVVMISSAMASLGVPGYALYSGTKAALHGFSDTLYYEPGQKGKITTVYPIGTKTNFFQEAGNSIPVAFPTQSAESVAKRIISGIIRGKRKIYPSNLFRTLLIIDKFLPPVLIIYRWMEQQKLLKWLNKKN